ncbi:MAG: sugar ABC transporter substrate-binding protein [Acidimicrobiales bacterium]
MDQLNQLPPPSASSNGRARRQYRRVGASVALLTAVLGFGAGTVPATAAAARPAAKATKPMHLAFFGYAAANAYTQAALKGVKSVAKRYAATVHFYDPNMSATTQLAQVEDAATSGKYNGMVVYSVAGDTVVPGVKEALARHIKAVADFVPIGPDIDTDKIQLHGLSGSVVVPIDLTGTAAGDLIVKACAGLNPCRVVYMPGDNTLPLEIDRTHHMLAVIKKHKNVDLVGTIQSGYASGTGYTAGENALTAHPNVNVIASSNDQAIVGVELAVKQHGDLKKIKLIGGGGTYQGVAGIKSGDWFGTVNYCPTTEAARATQILIDAMLGHPVKDNQVNSLTICGAPVQLTKSNLGSYKGEWSAG